MNLLKMRKVSIALEAKIVRTAEEPCKILMTVENLKIPTSISNASFSLRSSRRGDNPQAGGSGQKDVAQAGRSR